MGCWREVLRDGGRFQKRSAEQDAFRAEADGQYHVIESSYIAIKEMRVSLLALLVS